MRLQLIFAVLLATMATDALASNWQRVAEGDGNYTEVDVASLSRNGAIVKVWERKVYSELQVKSVGIVRAARALTLYDCNKRQLAIKQVQWFAGPDLAETVGNVSSTKDSQLEWTDIAPDSVGEIVLDFVCARAPRN